MPPIAHIETPFKTKFGVPRQAGLVDFTARIVFEPDYRVPEAVRGLEDFDYLWLIWHFHKISSPLPGSIGDMACDRSVAKLGEVAAQRADGGVCQWSPTVRPPRLGGNKRVGVFATRSPFRPNPLGLSSVRLLKVEMDAALGPLLYVSGADLVDGTPILDIKPYLPYADSHPDARSGFAAVAPPPVLTVDDPQGLLGTLSPDLRRALVDTLAQDPRPHYHDDPDRTYALLFDRYELKFNVINNKVTITSIALTSSACL